MDSIQTHDSELWAHLDAGDWRAAGTWLVEQHAHAVVNVCRAMVRDGATAEDLAQDVFSRAFTALQSYRGDATSRSWLLAIARNRCVDHLRARQREGGWRDTWGDESEPDMHPDRRTLPSDLLALRDEVEQALAGLSENERALVVLRFRHGLDYRELATVFGQRMGTLRMRLSRTLNRMRSLLEEADRLGQQRVSAQRAMLPRRTAKQERKVGQPQLSAARGRRPSPPRPMASKPPPAPGGPPPSRHPPSEAPPQSMPPPGPAYSPPAGGEAPEWPVRPRRYQQLEQLLEAIDTGVSRELLRRLFIAADRL